ncbi:hypothetical protein PSFL111601_08970 [Pseudomonas floridensis]
MSQAACARHRPTETADGASSVTTMPSTQRVNTSMARVKYGRPIGCRSRSSTTIRSMTVWSICTCSSGMVTSGGMPPAPCKGRAASCPPRLRAIFAGCSPAIRWATVLRAGTGSFWVLHACATSRWNAARLRFCLVRKRFCSSSRMMRSTGSGKRPLPLPPPDRPGVRSVTRPVPCRARRIRTYTCRRDRPSAWAASSAASCPTTSSAASGPMISVRCRACAHASSGRVATPCAAIGGVSDVMPKPRFGAHEY